MNSQYRMLSVFAAVLVAVSLACGAVAPTAVPPTQAPPPTANLPQPSTNDTSNTGADLVTFTDENQLLAFDLPGNWTHVNTPGDKYYTDTFTSPDESAKIESLVYNDGTPFVNSQNGQFALYLLNTFYSSTGKVGDIRISSDQTMKDGSDRLEWVSKGGAYSGVSYFETRGSDNKTFLMFTAWWSDGTDQSILDAINNAISSYVVP